MFIRKLNCIGKNVSLNFVNLLLCIFSLLSPFQKNISPFNLSCTLDFISWKFQNSINKKKYINIHASSFYFIIFFLFNKAFAYLYVIQPVTVYFRSCYSLFQMTTLDITLTVFTISIFYLIDSSTFAGISESCV